MGLQQFEERLERLVEGTLAKPFRSNLQPVEIGRRLDTRDGPAPPGGGARPHRAQCLRGDAVAGRRRVVSPTSSTRSPASWPTPPGSTPESRATRFVGPVDVRDLRGVRRSRPGRFTVTAEVREGEDGGFLAELVLPDGTRVTVGAEPLVIGRLPECDVVLADPNVSRRHAEFRRAGERCGRHRPRVHQRHPGQRGAGPRAAPGQRRRDHRRVDQARLRDVVTARWPRGALLATQNLQRHPAPHAVGGDRADLLLLPAGDAGGLGRGAPRPPSARPRRERRQER